MPQIKLSPLSRPTGYGDYVDSQYPWPQDTFLQAGFKGLVFRRDGGAPYQTAFVEAFPDGTFIRGEGSDIIEAEVDAWQKYRSIVGCPGHEYETRGYTNGAGFCKHCNQFQGNVFTGEQLGQFCHYCGEGTTYSHTRTIGRKHDEGTEKIWVCEAHNKEHDRKLYEFLKAFDGNCPLDEQMEINRLKFMLGEDEDD
jgi:hypothetical protein